MYNINRRKFLGYFGCGCCSLLLPSCSTVPITERKQLSIIPESRINSQAAAAYENFRSKSKLITFKSWYFSKKNGMKFDPIKPAPPVIKIFFMLIPSKFKAVNIRFL